MLNFGELIRENQFSFSLGRLGKKQAVGDGGTNKKSSVSSRLNILWKSKCSKYISFKDKNISFVQKYIKKKHLYNCI